MMENVVLWLKFLIWTHPFRQDIPTDTIVDQAEQVINPVIDTVSDRPENSEVIETNNWFLT
jgi:hypothetical protein